MDGRVDGHRRDGRIRRTTADGPVHRSVGPAFGRVHRRGDGTTVPGCRASYDIVFGVGRHTSRACYGHVPRLATGVGAVLRGAVRRLRAHMVYARVAGLAAGQGPGRSSRTGLAPVNLVDGDSDGYTRKRRTAAERATAAIGRGHHQAVRAPVLRAAVVLAATDRVIRVFFHPAVLRSERGRFLLGHPAKARRPRP